MDIRWYKNCDSEEIDLDDLNIYPEEWKNKKSYDLWDIAENKAGQSLFYMDYIYPDIDWGDQRKTVDRLCRELARIRINMIKDSPEKRLKMMKWMYVFEDEVENQC